MKKSIIKITAAAIFTFTSFNGFAQKVDIKPKIVESDKTTTADKTSSLTGADPQIVVTPKALTVNEQPKPIVPGGEFKPMETDKPVKNYAKTPAPVKVFEQQVLQKQ